MVALQALGRNSTAYAPASSPACHACRAAPIDLLGLALLRSCGHSARVAVAPWLIRYGPTASSELLRENACCELCRSRGASLRLPSWGGLDVGIAPFPADRLAKRLSAPLGAAGVAQVE